MQGKVETIKLLSHLKAGLDYCEIQIDFDALKIFGNYNDLLGFVGEIVKYEVAEDFFQGQTILRVVDLAFIRVIQTVSSEHEVMKLIPGARRRDEFCTVSVDAIRRGDKLENCIAVLYDTEKGSSNYSRWVDMQMVDMYGKSFVVRMFTDKILDGVDEDLFFASAKNHYVRFSLASTKYGFQTESVLIENTVVAPPEEVEIAIKQIESALAVDEELLAYANQYNYIECLKSIMYCELGYHLVEVATELNILDTYNNVSREYDIKLLRRAIITSRGYLLPHKNEYSKTLLNTNMILRSGLKNDVKLIQLLDFQSGDIPLDKRAYYRIRRMGRDIINERRGLSEESIPIDSIVDFL